MPEDVETYIERLHLAQKMSLAAALHNQCDSPHPIGRYYSYSLAEDVETYIELLPLTQKRSLATALLNQCNPVFQKTSYLPKS
jgi:hypothetical protein